MSQKSHVLMVSPNGQEWKAPLGYVERAKEKGHRLAEAPFDPSAHNVDEVKAHLEQADEAEAARVIDAERAGKNRTSITGD